MLIVLAIPSWSQRSQIQSVDSLIALTGKLLDIKLDSAEQTARSALKIAEKLNLRNQQLLLQERLGMVELRKGNYDACKSFLDQIFKECERSDCSPDVLGIAHNTLGAYYFRTGNALAAGDNFLKSADYYKKSSTPERAQASLMNSATVLVNTGGKQKAFEIFKSIVNNPESDTINIYKAYSNMATIRTSEYNFKEAISLFLKAQDIAGRAGIEDNSLNYNLALAYEENGQYPEALKLYQQIAAQFESSGEKRMLLKVNQGMANTYAALKNNTKALEYLQKAEQNLDTTEQRLEYIDLLAMKHLLYANMGNYREAYKYLVDYQRESMDSELKDSQEKYMELQTKYETEQKEMEITLQQKTIANQRTVLIANIALLAGIIAFAVYIYLVGRQKDKLNRELRDKKEQVELLHRELRHRISNNLSFITSLMQIHSRRLTNPEALEVLFDSESRVRAMSLLHRKLNSDESNYTQISLKNYLEEILMNLKQSYPFDRTAPEISMRIDEISIDAENAMRIGLIINELVTNAYKHAFPGSQAGHIAIGIQHGENDKIRITYRDDGVGLPQNIDLDSTDRMGMVLIRSLAGMLQSQPKFSTDNGTIFEMEIAA